MRLRFPKPMHEGENRLTYGVRVEAMCHGEWIPAVVNGRIVSTGRPGDQERIRLVDGQGRQFYGYPTTVRMPAVSP